MHRNFVLCTVFTIAGSLAACSRGNGPEPATPRPERAAVSQDTAGAGGRGAGAPRPYARVITPEARTRVGLFKTHLVGDRLYCEIPKSELNKDMIVMSRPITATGGFGGGPGAGNRVVAWERDGHRIVLRGRSFEISADTAAAIYSAVAAQRTGPIIARFNIEAWGPDSASVIEVTRLFTTNVPEFAAVNTPTADRSFVESAVAFPDVVNVVYTQTGTQTPQASAAGRGPGGSGSQQRAQATTVRVHWSMLKLPEDPMRPRLHDRRIGLNSVTTIDYSRPEHRAEERRYVRRYRLEKRDPNAEISEPVKPIVFWIDPATPEWLVPWVKKGIEAWRPAYEGAGFRNAIEGRVAPANDPDFSMFDARYSVIYWRPSTTQNATGGQVVDPRTGEILKAEVNMYHNVMNLLRNWYFTQVGPLDPRARNLPLPDSLMGRLVEYVVTHEVGHAIGFPHNMKASAMYPADSIRSVEFLRRMGSHVATLMDYSRFNYVAQPEDNIPLDLLIPVVGPYDRFAIMWQNKPIPGARTPDDERPVLDQWARMQDSIPWLRFETSDATADPHALTEAVGDNDAVKSSTLGMRNLRRVSEMLIEATVRPGNDYSLLNELYGNMVSQWGRYNNHVAAIIGGAETFERYGTGPRFEPLAEERQREAMRYLAQNAFQVPDFIVREDILRRIEQEGITTRVRNAQAGVLNSLLSTQRLNRLVEYEVLADEGGTYTLAEMLADLRRAVWTELTAANVRVDVFRRNLQRAYLEAVDRQLNPPEADEDGPAQTSQQQPRYPSDVRPALRGELLEIDRLAAAALNRTNDAMTRLHLRDVRMEIEKILDR